MREVQAHHPYRHPGLNVLLLEPTGRIFLFILCSELREFARDISHRLVCGNDPRSHFAENVLGFFLCLVIRKRFSYFTVEVYSLRLGEFLPAMKHSRNNAVITWSGMAAAHGETRDVR